MASTVSASASSQFLPTSSTSHAWVRPAAVMRSAIPAGDGGSITIGIQNAREWTRFCADVLRRSELADDDHIRVQVVGNLGEAVDAANDRVPVREPGAARRFAAQADDYFHSRARASQRRGYSVS